MSPRSITFLEAGAVRDARGIDARPGAIAIRAGRIVAAGPPAEVRRRCRGEPVRTTIERPGVLVIPAMVNAHAHLDLAGIGSLPASGSFADWIEMTMQRRPTHDDDIARNVHDALRASRAAGVGWIGDVAGSDAAVIARLTIAPRDCVPGCSFLECFGIGRAAKDAAAVARRRRDDLARSLDLPPARADIDSDGGGGDADADIRAGVDVDVGLQPHAPYSAGPELFAAAADLPGVPASCHLAETREELQFVADASGPLADLLRRLGKWDDTIPARRQSPVAAFREHLARGRWVVAHCNYLDDADVRILGELTGVSVAYCPIASEYFGHREHRYRELLAAGVNVCLGTDSAICQPTPEPQPHGVLPQMRRLFRRDRTDPVTLLEMATTRGLRALERPPRAATFDAGVAVRAIEVAFDPADPTDPLIQALENDQPAAPVDLPDDA